MKTEDILILNFKCEDDLSKYTDSMLFDSGEVIASGSFAFMGNRLDIDLVIAGDVAVTYKEDVYHSPSEFPDELKELIRSDRWWDTNDNVYVGLNNWFEYVYEGDGDVLEDDLSKMTKEDVKSDMLEIASMYFDRIDEGNKDNRRLFIVRDNCESTCIYGILEVSSAESVKDIEDKIYETLDEVREDDEWQVSDLVAALPKEWNAKLRGYEDVYV